jgi:lambda family phage tail tape measure protein
MANLKVVLELDSAGYVRNIKAAEDSTNNFSNSAKQGAKEASTAFDTLSNKSEKLFTGMTKLKAVLVGAALVSFGRSSIAAADAISDLADATDLAIPKILEIEQALVQSGGKAEGAAKLITAFYKSVSEAAGGSDKTQEALGKLGITFDMLKTASPEKLFDTATKGLVSIQDPATKTALAIDIFGKSMIGVSPNKFAEELASLQGEFAGQAASIQRAADLNDQWEKSIFKLRLAFLEAFTPAIENMTKILEIMPALTTAFKVLGAVIVAVFVATGIRSFVSILGQAVAGVKLLASGLTLVRSRVSGKLIEKSATVAEKTSARAQVAGGAAAVVAGVSTMAVLSGTAKEGTEQAKVGDEVEKQRGRQVEIGKELAGQLKAVNELMSGYRRAAQANLDRYSMEVDLLGKTEDEVDVIKGRAEIEKRYADETAALEQKKVGAKGATLALITKSISELQDLKSNELDIFEITKGQVVAYKQRQEEIKRSLEYSAELLRQEQAGIDSLSESINSILTGSFKKMREEQEASANKALPELQRRLASIAQEERNLAEAAKERVAAQFENDPQGLMGAQRAIEAAQKTATERRQQQAKEQYDQQRLFTTGWEEAFTKYADDANNAASQAGQYFQSFSSGFENAIVKFVQTGKLSFKDMANSIIADFARIQAKKMFMSLFGGGDMGSGLLGKFFGGFFANGGTLGSGKFGVAGENGPELISGPATITPLTASAAPTMVTYNIQAVDASSFRSLVARDPGFIHAVAERGRQSQPTRRA